MAPDILLLTVYFICVVYVLYQMALSVEAKLEDQIQIVLDKEAIAPAIAPQLSRQNRPDITATVVDPGKIPPFLEITLPPEGGSKDKAPTLQIQISPQGRKPLRPPVQNLGVILINGSPDHQVFIDWDRSSITVHGGLAQRVIRTVPGMPLDLLQPQVFTVANPTQAVSATVTSETLYRRSDKGTALESVPVLVNLENIPKLKENQRFYALRLFLWIKPTNAPDSAALQLLIPFTFRIEILPDHVALPVLSWVLDVFSAPRLPRIW